jgi:hypothetical protein
MEVSLRKSYETNKMHPEHVGPEQNLDLFFDTSRAWANNSHVETVKYLINKKKHDLNKH